MPNFLLIVLVMFLMVAFRYFLVAGIFFYVFHIKKAGKIRKITAKPYAHNQFRKEIYWSLLSSSIFAFFGASTFVLWYNGYTQIYLNVNDFGWVYFFTSLLIAMFLHETYYYFLHRWMHQPKIYRLVHKVHHDSFVPSPWTAFSFHPLEATLEALILPLIVLVLPLHYYVIVLHLSIMTLSSVVNHLDIEIYPKGSERHFIGKWWIGATHHSLHHKQFKYNFGLYFTFWDKVLKTESPIYEQKFREQKLDK